MAAGGPPAAGSQALVGNLRTAYTSDYVLKSVLRQPLASGVLLGCVRGSSASADAQAMLNVTYATGTPTLAAVLLMKCCHRRCHRSYRYLPTICSDYQGVCVTLWLSLLHL